MPPLERQRRDWLGDDERRSTKLANTLSVVGGAVT